MAPDLDPSCLREARHEGDGGWTAPLEGNTVAGMSNGVSYGNGVLAESQVRGFARSHSGPVTPVYRPPYRPIGRGQNFSGGGTFGISVGCSDVPAIS